MADLQRRLPANVYDPECASRQLLDVVVNKWSPLILLLLNTGTMRYNEIRREIVGLSHKMLTQTLRSLEDEKLITRTVYPVVPPHVEYALTPAGEALIDSLRSLIGVIENHINTRGDAKAS